MQKARRHPQAPTACKRMVSGSFHSLSQGSFHLSFTVLVRYRSHSSIQPQQMVLLYSDRVSPAPPYSNNIYITFTYGTITLYGLIFQKILLVIKILQGCSAFARHYLRNNYCYLFLRVLRCFSSPGYLSLRSTMSSTQWVSPFGHLRIKGYLHLPVAFRSLSRPSSSL